MVRYAGWWMRVKRRAGSHRHSMDAAGLGRRAKNGLAAAIAGRPWREDALASASVKKSGSNRSTGAAGQASRSDWRAQNLSPGIAGSSLCPEPAAVAGCPPGNSLWPEAEAAGCYSDNMQNPGPGA